MYRSFDRSIDHGILSCRMKLVATLFYRNIEKVRNCDVYPALNFHHSLRRAIERGEEGRIRGELIACHAKRKAHTGRADERILVNSSLPQWSELYAPSCDGEIPPFFFLSTTPVRLAPVSTHSFSQFIRNWSVASKYTQIQHEPKRFQQSSVPFEYMFLHYNGFYNRNSAVLSIPFTRTFLHREILASTNFVPRIIKSTLLFIYIYIYVFLLRSRGWDKQWPDFLVPASAYLMAFFLDSSKRWKAVRACFTRRNR